MPTRPEGPHLSKAQPAVTVWHAFSRFVVFSAALPLFVGTGALWLAARWAPGRLVVDALLLWGWPAGLMAWLVGRLVLRWMRRFVVFGGRL